MSKATFSSTKESTKNIFIRSHATTRYKEKWKDASMSVEKQMRVLCIQLCVREFTSPLESLRKCLLHFVVGFKPLVKFIQLV